MPFSGGICPKCLKTNNWFNLLVCVCVCVCSWGETLPRELCKGQRWAAKVSSLGQGQAGQPPAAAAMPGTFWGTLQQTRKQSNSTRLQVRHRHQMLWVNKYTHSCGRAVLKAGETQWNDDNPTEPCLESRGIISLHFSGFFQCFFWASHYLTHLQAYSCEQINLN